MTSAPASTWKYIGCPLITTFAFHELCACPWTVATSVSSPGKNASSYVSEKLTSFTFFRDRDLQAFARCATLERLIHWDSLVGHCLFECDGSRHLKNCASGVFSVPFLGLWGFFASFGLVLTSFPFPLDKRSTLASVCSDLFPYMKVCCFFTVSDCLALVTAFSKVSLGSSCSCSESFLPLNLQRFCLWWDHLLMF